MASHDIIVIGASAGGVEALTQLVRGLPVGVPASFFVVCHFPEGARSALPDILSRSGMLLAVHPHDGDLVHPGQIYVAPPGRHMVLEDSAVRLTRGPQENGHRPAIDVLFRSAARCCGSRVIAVVLSGAMFDGVGGLLAVRSAGGIAVIQDPEDAVVAMLPRNAATLAGADHIISADRLAALLVELVRQPAPRKEQSPMDDPIEKISQTQARDAEAQQQGERRGALTVFTCPACGGSLWQSEQKDLVQFRCHVGHAYHAEALLAEQADVLEAALWTAVRTFKDRMVLARQLANAQRQRGELESAARHEEQARQAERYSESIHQYLLGGI